MNLTAADYRAQLTPASYFGQSGWWYFPQTSYGNIRPWYSYTDRDNQIWVSPTPDFSVLKYAAKINSDGYLVVYDQYLNTQSGISSGLPASSGSLSRSFAQTYVSPYVKLSTPAPVSQLLLTDFTTNSVYRIYVSGQELVKDYYSDKPDYFSVSFINLFDIGTGGVKRVGLNSGLWFIDSPDTSQGWYDFYPFIDQNTGTTVNLTLSQGQLIIT